MTLKHTSHIYDLYINFLNQYTFELKHPLKTPSQKFGNLPTNLNIHIVTKIPNLSIISKYIPPTKIHKTLKGFRSRDYHNLSKAGKGTNNKFFRGKAFGELLVVNLEVLCGKL